MRTVTSYHIRVLLILALVPGLSLAQYGGGKGTSEEPYLIETVSHLRTLTGDSANWDKYFQLTADLDLSDMSLYPISQGASFTGLFDGNGHTISHFTCSKPWNRDIGLFARVGTDGVIMNLGVTDVSMQGSYSVGVLAGYNAGTITGCFTTGRCTGRYYVGGLVGENDGTISRCYSMAEVSGEDDVGGLVGRHSGGTLVECYAAGGVSSTYSSIYVDMGGLVGNDWAGAQDCFWDKQTSGQTFSGLDYSSGAIGKTTAQMQDMQTFQSSGWDFAFGDNGSDDVWAMPSGGGYPILWW